MNKLILAVVLAILASGTAAHANEREVALRFKIEGGQLMATQEDWSPTGVKVTPAAEEHPAAVAEAFRNGGIVPVVTQEVSTVVDFSHYRMSTVRTLGVQRAADGVIDVVKTREVFKPEGEKRFFWFPVFWLGVVTMFLISLVRPSSSAPLWAGLLAVVSAFSLLLPGESLIQVRTIVSVVIVFCTAVPAILSFRDSKEKHRWRYKLAFLVCIIAGLIIVYWQLLF